MSSIDKLSLSELNKLYTVDPMLDSNWQQQLVAILPKLDKEDQRFFMQKVLAPKGILFDSNQKKFVSTPPMPLAALISTTPIENQQLANATENLLTLYPSKNEALDAVAFLDKIETGLALLDKVPPSPILAERKQQQAVKTSFLYDCILWLHTTPLTMPTTVRNINEAIFKEFVKYVYLKSLIQGKDFDHIEPTDLELNKVANFPDFLKDEVQSRRLLAVETPHCWFVLSPTEKPNQNPFSAKRFLHEEKMGDGYVYLNGLALPKSLVNDSTAQQVILNQVARIFGFDQNISEELQKYTLHLKQLTKTELVNTLNDSTSEQAIDRCVTKFEETLTMYALQSLPTMFGIAKQSEFNQFFLLQNLERFFADCIGLLERFSVRPLARQSLTIKTLLAKISCLDILIRKNRGWIFDNAITNNERQQELSLAMQSIKDKYEEVIVRQTELFEMREELDEQSGGGFLSKLGFGKPKYTQEMITDELLELNEKFFIGVLQATKEHRRAIVCVEQETDYELRGGYHHYAIAHPKSGFARLPHIINLAEDKRHFSLSTLTTEPSWKIFTQINAM